MKILAIVGIVIVIVARYFFPYPSIVSLSIGFGVAAFVVGCGLRFARKERHRSAHHP
jgi:hypothetical protein